MKKNWIVVALALTLSIGVGTSVYANSDTTTNANGSEITASKDFGGKRAFGMAKENGPHKVLTDKFGISKEALAAARSEGKTIADLLKEKGISIDDFRTALIENHNKSIEEAVANGKLTPDQGEEIKAKMKTRIEEDNFDKVKPMKEDKGDKVGFKIMGKGNMNKVLTEKFGITSDELKSAIENGKAINTLLQEKGVSLEQFKLAVIETQNADIDEAVANEKITEDQGKEMKSRIEERMDNFNGDEVFKGNKIKGEKGPRFEKKANGVGTSTESQTTTGV